jgi:hypothetical protein
MKAQAAAGFCFPASGGHAEVLNIQSDAKHPSRVVAFGFGASVAGDDHPTSSSRKCARRSRPNHRAVELIDRIGRNSSW